MLKFILKCWYSECFLSEFIRNEQSGFIFGENLEARVTVSWFIFLLRSAILLLLFLDIIIFP